VDAPTRISWRKNFGQGFQDIFWQVGLLLIAWNGARHAVEPSPLALLTKVFVGVLAAAHVFLAARSVATVTGVPRRQIAFEQVTRSQGALAAYVICLFAVLLFLQGHQDAAALTFYAGLAVAGIIWARDWIENG
jgi:hypothetical protein